MGRRIGIIGDNSSEYVRYFVKTEFNPVTKSRFNFS